MTWAGPGGINFVGIYQKESSAFARPALGFEASANLVAGVNTDLHFRPTALSRLVSSITNRNGSVGGVPRHQRASSPSPARTRTEPGRRTSRNSRAYREPAVSLGAAVWQYGSVPQSTAGLDPTLGFGATFDTGRRRADDLAEPHSGPDGGVVQFFPENIDPNIVTAGRSQVPETVMYLTLHADTAGGVVQQNNKSQWTQPPRPNTPRWRSMQTALSTVGVDFTANTYIEFWLFNDAAKSAENAGVNLVFDLGQVSEDAVGVAPDTLRVEAGNDSLYVGRQYVGVGVLNTERQPNGIFNAQDNDIGILGDIPSMVLPNLDVDPAYPLCQTVLGTSVQVFPWGDLSARCTRGNGFLDTEDLNGDNILNAQGPNDNVNRYVVSLTDTQYVVRKGVTDPITGRGLDPVPRSAAHATAVIGTPNIRLVQALRLTIVAPPALDDIVARLALSRLTFVGAPWLARAPAPIAGHCRLDGGAHRQRGGVRGLHAGQEPRVRATARRDRGPAGSQRRCAEQRQPRSTRSRFVSSPGNWPRGRARRRTSGFRRATSDSCRIARCGCGCAAATTCPTGTPADCWATSRWKATPTTSTCTRRRCTAMARKRRGTPR